MTNAHSHQARQESIMSGQQCLRSPIDGASNQMNARRLWIPSQINVVEGHQSRKRHGMAATHSQECYEVLSRDCRDTKKAHESHKEKCQIYNTSGTSKGGRKNKFETTTAADAISQVKAQKTRCTQDQRKRCKFFIQGNKCVAVKGKENTTCVYQSIQCQEHSLL